MEIRPLNPKDLDSYFALRLEMLQQAPDAFLCTYEEQKKEGLERFSLLLSKQFPGNALFGAFLNGKLSGCVGLACKEGRVKSAHKADIWGMYVAPEARRQGVGEALIAEVIGHARGKLGVNTLCLTVEGGNKEARKLYERAGFKVWGTEPRGMRVEEKFVEEHHMWLPLD